MNEKQFIILCIITSIIGILILYIADINAKPKNVKISEINLNENFVAFNATIISIKRSDSATFIKVKDDSGIIDVVIFDNINTTGLKTGMNIKVIGKPQRYKEKIEVIPLKIIS
ncbi:MAG: OB-fold nucleic acid binding domain-containing protein [Candidatus Aenigmarchaeota archaeon]|nr:OB-fold nucleic acid binding domain-containing protein [Candidatus Aenigmarchaeota archaeon]